MATRLPAPRRRRQLLDVATAVFGGSGYHEASMDEVAEAAGVTKPVLYQHFASKRELYLELLDDVGTRLIDAVVAATRAAEDPHQQVEAGFRAYFGFVAGHANAFRLLFGGARQPDEECVAVAERVAQVMADIIAGLIDVDLDPEHRRLLGHAVVGLAEATSRQWVRQDMQPDAGLLARWIADAAWSGLRGLRPD
jgi:AcrR family transcriptional regulator